MQKNTILKLQEEIENRIKILNITKLKYELNIDNFKSFYCCRENDSYTYSFRILFAPNLICLTGDCGDLLLKPGRDKDSLKFLIGNIDNIDYIIEKVPNYFNNNDKVYCVEIAKNYALELLKERELDMKSGVLTIDNYSKYEDLVDEFCDDCENFETEKEFYEAYNSLSIELGFDYSLEGVDVLKYNDFAINKFTQLKIFVELFLNISSL